MPIPEGDELEDSDEYKKSTIPTIVIPHIEIPEKIIKALTSHIAKLKKDPLIFFGTIKNNDDNDDDYHAIFVKYKKIKNDKNGKEVPTLLFSDINESYIPRSDADENFINKLSSYNNPILSSIRLNPETIIFGCNYMTGKIEHAFDYIRELMVKYNQGLEEFPEEMVKSVNDSITEIINESQQTKGGKNKNMNIVLFIFVLLCVISLLVVIIIIITNFCKYHKVKKLNNCNV
jgi:hypothetical protein